MLHFVIFNVFFYSMKLLQTEFIQCYSNFGIKKYHSTFAVEWELNKRKHSFTNTNKKAIIDILKIRFGS